MGKFVLKFIAILVLTIVLTAFTEAFIKVFIIEGHYDHLMGEYEKYETLIHYMVFVCVYIPLYYKIFKPHRKTSD